MRGLEREAHRVVLQHSLLNFDSLDFRLVAALRHQHFELKTLRGIVGVNQHKCLAILSGRHVVADHFVSSRRDDINAFQRPAGNLVFDRHHKPRLVCFRLLEYLQEELRFLIGLHQDAFLLRFVPIGHRGHLVVARVLNAKMRCSLLIRLLGLIEVLAPDRPLESDARTD